MLRLITFFAALIIAMPASWADDWPDCAQDKDRDLKIEGCSALITKEGEPEHTRALAYYNRGFAYYRNNNFDRAIADYTRATELNPKYVYAYSGRGNAYEAKGDHDRAIADYTKAFEIDPKFAIAYYNRGNAYEAKRDHDRAIDDYTKAIELDPKFAIAYDNRGNAYEAKDDFHRAVADYEKAIQRNPNTLTPIGSRIGLLQIGQGRARTA